MQRSEQHCLTEGLPVGIEAHIIALAEIIATQAVLDHYEASARVETPSSVQSTELERK